MYLFKKTLLFPLFLLFTFFFTIPYTVFADIGDESGGTLKAINDKVTIEYYSGLDENVAKWTKGAIEKAWPKYTTNSGNEISKLNIQIGHLMMRDDKTKVVDEPYGVTTFNFDTNTCNIIISTVNSNKEIIEATTVHELMHCWQYDMRWSSYGTSTEWMSEATAVWTEDWLYDHNTEFEYLKERFSSFNSDFFSLYGTRDYGSYLYFKFLKQNGLITPKGIFSLLKKHKNKTQEEVLSSQDNLYTILKEYALWNLNFAEFRKYDDNPEFLHVLPSGNSKERFFIDEPKEYKIDFNMFRGGTKYMIIYVDDKINKLEFKTKEFNTLSDEKLGLQALVKIDGKYEYEDWSTLEKRQFCRNRESEKVDKIILFANHSDLSIKPQMHSGSIPVDSTGECPVQWTGTTIFKKKGGGNILPMEEELIMTEILEETPDDDGNIELVVKEQTVNVSGKTETKSGCLFPSCSGSMGSERNYSGTTHRTLSLDPEWPIVRFAYAGDGKYEFVGTDQIYGECDYVTETNRSYADCSCPNMGSSNIDDTSVETDSCHDGPDYQLEIPIEYIPGKTKHIKGKTEGDSPDGNYTESITWDYVYE